MKRHLMSWGTGKAGLLPTPPADGTTATLVLERADHLTAAVASGLAGPESVVFVPTSADGGDGGVYTVGGPTVVHYEGSLSDAGGEFSVGSSFFLQSQTYGVSPYMSVVGPTLVRIADETDFQYYLDDADQAREAGVFSDFLTHPVIQLADVCALGSGPSADGPQWRLHIAASGTVSTSPHGRPLGTLGASPEQLQHAWTQLRTDPGEHGCPVCLGSVLDQPARADALAARPWLGRYLAALDSIRDLRARGLSEPRVSGFGARLLPELAELGLAADVPSAAAPLLLWTDQAAFVHTVDRSRTFQLDLALAPAVEALLGCGSAEDPERFADRGLLERARASLRAVGVELHRAESVGAGV
ncbi:daptide biosynthesis RiPP recognition protein [Streptacidiphilus sp. N1-12]|uniref:Daptide biosynthesis RiPP recognition protein n=2 Tax=Streptacidiphilus alkalitolerans TaxID=3342712 RepID=A0ABV6W855_9ACTN